jgi:hypothetical protein
MARFIGRLKGGRGEVSRLGTPASGIEATVNGWDVGVRVTGGCGESSDSDVFFVYSTGGSNHQCSEVLVAVIQLDRAAGTVVAEGAAEYNARIARLIKGGEPELVPGARAAAKRVLAAITVERRPFDWEGEEKSSTAWFVVRDGKVIGGPCLTRRDAEGVAKMEEEQNKAAWQRKLDNCVR